MKSLRVFVCILITTLSLFVAFSSPEKSFAAVSESDYNLLKRYSNDLDFDYRTIMSNALLPSNWRDLSDSVNSDVAVEYLDALDKNYSALKNDPSATKDILKQKTLTDFVSYLNGKIPGESGFRKSALEAVQTKAVYDLKLAISAVQLADGKITADQNIANRATANAELNKSLQARQDAQNSGKCGFFDPGACVSDALTWFIKTFLLEIAGFLLWATASIFNYSIIVGVLNFAQWAPDTLYPIWLVVRQILSLIIVFVGLYLGFLYIIGDEKERFKRYMPWVITFALFVNFSYPLARTVIDVSNIITLKVYTSAIGDGTLNPSSTGSATAGGIIVSRLGLQGLIAGSKGTPTGSTIDMVKNINSVPASLLLVVFIVYSAYIFFMVTALIVVRTAAFVFMIVVSPLLFVDSVLPMLGEKAKEMRKIFLDQLIIGPVFMIMLALTLKFLEVFSDGALKSVAVDTTIRDFFNLLLMLIMLHIMLKVTKSVSGQLGTFATDAIGKVGGLGLGVATGGMAFAGRKAIGGMAMKARESGWIRNNQDSFIGRKMYDMSNSLSKSTFDLRNSKVVAGGMEKAGFGKGVLGMGGMGIGTGAKLGHEEELAAKKKDVHERRDRIKTRYERDEYEKDSSGEIKRDENGQPIYAHRKGDIDPVGSTALNRYVATAGGSRFMTKAEKSKLRGELGDKTDTETDKRIAELKAKSAKDIETYNNIRDVYHKDGSVAISAKDQQAKFLKDLEKELEDIKKTDPSLRGDQGQALQQSVQSIKKNKSAKAFEEYNNLKDTFGQDGKVIVSADSKKAEFLKDLEKQLKEIQLTDPRLGSDAAQTLLKNIKNIKDKEIEDKKTFNDQVEESFKRYLRKNDDTKKQKEYLDNLPEKIRGVVEAKIQENKDGVGGVDIDLSEPKQTPQGTGPVDIDLSTPAANNPSYAGATSTPGATTSTPTKSLIVDEHGNSFDLAGAIGGDREAARAARARRTKPENTATNTNTPKDATVAA